jgi:hypothetical protein
MAALMEEVRQMKEAGEAQGAKVAVLGTKMKQVEEATSEPVGGLAEQEQMAKLEGYMREVEVRLGGELRDLREALGRWKETAAVEVVSEVRDGTAPKKVGRDLLEGLRWSF